MNFIAEKYGQPSYILKSNMVTGYIAVQGGTILADFKVNNSTVSPFMVAPWWNEAYDKDLPVIDRVLRGCFFCLPFGANTEPSQGMSFPLHGFTANGCWEVDNKSVEPLSQSVTLGISSKVTDSSSLEVHETITVKQNQPILYISAIAKGADCQLPLGFHPTLQLTPDKGSCIFDMSEPITGFTPPFPVEEAVNQGYSLLKCGQEINDLTNVKTIYDESVNLRECPIGKGYEDVAFFLNDPQKSFTYSAVTVKEKGYLYFQLKNPRNLTATMLWMSNGGRYYKPWNGRVNGVLGIEEVNSYFYYGMKQSAEPNPLTSLGYRTAAVLSREQANNYKIIIGTVPVPEDFEGVKDIIRKDAQHICILGRNGDEITVACEIDFLLNDISE